MRRTAWRRCAAAWLAAGGLAACDDGGGDVGAGGSGGTGGMLGSDAAGGHPETDASGAGAGGGDDGPPDGTPTDSTVAPGDARPGGGDAAAPCEPGAVDGCFDDTARRVCAPDGAGFVPDPCPEDLRCHEGECRALVCAPGLPTCAGPRTPARCNDEGTGFVALDDCPEGAACRSGECRSECLLAGKDPSYIGCEYWSVDLDNYPDPVGNPAAVPHAVVIGNPSASLAHVLVTTQAAVALPAAAIDVPPGEVRVYTFPRLDVDGTGITNHTFRLQSDWPVVAYQFNPLNNVNVYSNDASLLLPAESLGTDYVVMSWPTTPIPDILGLPPQHGYVTIVATRPGETEVSVVPTSLVEAGPDLPEMEPGVEQTFNLQQFDVLNLEADGSNLFSPTFDLTGTTIHASQPVAVFGGHEEAAIGGCCADHLEEQLFPVSTWGTRYHAAQSEPRGGSRDIWRVLAAADATEVSTLPPQPGAEAFVLNRGEWRDIQTGDTFEVVADKQILVGQFLESQEVTVDFIGDPSFILAVPVIQYRSRYPVLVPADYDENWFSVIRPAGVEVRLDGVPVDEALFRGFGLGTHEHAWVPADEGSHLFESEVPFGLVGHGYSGAVSYGYPAGLDLRAEPEAPPP